MAYSTPRTWVAGEYPTAAQLNANVRDNVSFLANPPACRVYHNANQSITNNTETALAFNSERYDTNAMHDTVTNNSRITIATAGLYVVTANVFFAANATGVREIYLKVNNATYVAIVTQDGSSANNRILTASATWKFAAADYVEARVLQTSGGALNVTAAAAYSPEFAATWVGLG